MACVVIVIIQMYNFVCKGMCLIFYTSLCRQTATVKAYVAHDTDTVRTYGVVVFDDELPAAGATKLYERRRLDCNWITPASSGSLLNTPTTYVLIFIMYADLNCVTYVLF